MKFQQTRAMTYNHPAIATPAETAKRGTTKSLIRSRQRLRSTSLAWSAVGVSKSTSASFLMACSTDIHLNLSLSSPRAAVLQRDSPNPCRKFDRCEFSSAAALNFLRVEYCEPFRSAKWSWFQTRKMRACSLDCRQRHPGEHSLTVTSAYCLTVVQATPAHAAESGSGRTANSVRALAGSLRIQTLSRRVPGDSGDLKVSGGKSSSWNSIAIATMS
jgi:hypothetical protein